MKHSIKSVLAITLSAAVITLSSAAAESGAVQTAPADGGTVWRYTDERTKPFEGAAWAAADFDASGWKTGAGSFGEKDGKLKELSGGVTAQTLLRETKSGKTVPVYYFRGEFEANVLPEADFYKADVAYDDSAVIYLNGTPIYYGNAPADGYGDDGYGAQTALDGPNEDSFLIDPALIRQGKNVIAAEVHQCDDDSSDAYFSLKNLSPAEADLSDIRNNTLCLGVGSDETRMLVTWQGKGEQGYVEVTGPGYPANAAVFPAVRAYSNVWGTATFRAEITGLRPGAKYYYRVADSGYSKVSTFTAPAIGNFSFLVTGDPQLNDVNDPAPVAIYDSIISQASAAGKYPAFLMTLGDQSEAASNPELYMRYLSSAFTERLPWATIIGNHDRGFDTISRFFYMPNMDGSTRHNAGDMSGDYWFRRGNTLFLCINSNNHDIDAHVKFLNGAKASYTELYGQPAWTVAAFHHAIYSVGDHADDDGIEERREKYTPIFKSIGVDVVFTGHDHSYTRSKTIDGTVYFTLGSSTGTKYYDHSDDKYDFDAFTFQEPYPCITKTDVTADSFTVTTYRLNSDGGLTTVDQITLTK